MSEVRLVVGTRHRHPGKLDLFDPEAPERPVPSAAGLLEAAAPHLGAQRWLLWGGEPTQRTDLPRLLRALSEAGAPSLGLHTDGLALAKREVVRGLAGFGLSWVRIPLHSGRADAHDWLVGIPGAAKRARRALAAVKAEGLGLEVEIVLTRSTTPYIAETVELAIHLGADAIRIRRPLRRFAAGREFVTISPRFGLAQPYLQDAVFVAGRRGVPLTVTGFPACALPDVAERLDLDGVVWVTTGEAGWEDWRPPGVPHREGCERCPGPPDCAGAPADYVDRFGYGEIRSQSNVLDPGAHAEVVAWYEGAVKPPPRAGRFPASRVAYAVMQAERDSLGGDPMLGLVPQPVPRVLRTIFATPPTVACPTCGDHAASPEQPETTRAVRQRLMDAAQQGAWRLRVASAGSISHPEAAELLPETKRLSVPRVELCGEASGLDALTDRQMRRMRGVHEVHIALYGPDAERHDAHVGRSGAFREAIDGVERLAGLIHCEAHAFAVLHDGDDLGDWAAWDGLPGQPAFRLSPDGASLAGLAEAAADLGGPARDALARVLPPCLLPRDDSVSPAESSTPGWGNTPPAEREPSGSDRLGTYEICPHAGECAAASQCPGLATGWDPDRIQPL